MINYKYTLLFTLFFLLSCSSSEKVKPLNSVNIHTKNVITFAEEKERVNAKLEDIFENIEILNSKSQNLKNSLINYPFKKSWQLDTNQIINDENPYLPEPLFFPTTILPSEPVTLLSPTDKSPRGLFVPIPTFPSL